MTTGAAGRIDNLEDRVLAAHNRERAKLDIPALAWNQALAVDAQKWGNHLAKLGRLEHYPDNPADPDPQGENLWAGTRGYYSAESMVGLWIAERKNFKPGLFPNNTVTGNLEDIGHYTQLMWRSSHSVGCALIRGRADEFLVCRYSEGGNVMGERPF
ncbi:CAP domain-containing protein [Sphingobium boeckii]|uniref:Uncharacterized protein YkwD n=1 Tax=Sphingobium boeckii TaxID=1082345 RepID=A0A7W9EGE8_9SPHN|nr:CAP domain-containing protein [Sphingobium boeckii]MBB5686646.1 uncharacterized protein YkwD [Sphingobium boeckii]